MDQYELANRFEELSLRVSNCKSLVVNNGSYVTIAQVEEWSNNMKVCATELNSLFSDSLRHLSTKIS